MPKSRKFYRDQSKYSAYARRMKQSYRNLHGNFQFPSRPWTVDEDAKVLAHDVPDSKLMNEIQRSVQAIQGRRWRLKQQNYLLEEIGKEGS